MLHNIPKVEEFKTATGNVVQNQYLIHTNEGIYFQSYNSTIAFMDTNRVVYLDAEKWNYSKTTGKYRSVFLNESIAETRAKISLGEHIITNLNE